MQQLVTIVTRDWHLGNQSQAVSGRLEGQFTATTRCFFLYFFYSSPSSIITPPHLCIPFCLLSSCLHLCLTSSFPHLSHTSPPGDVQSCSCPFSRHGLSLPVPERLVGPAGLWQCISHALGRWDRNCWTIHVLLLCHFACAGMNPWKAMLQLMSGLRGLW